MRGGCFPMGGLFSIFHKKSTSKAPKTCNFAYFTSQWGGLEPPHPPWLRYWPSIRFSPFFCPDLDEDKKRSSLRFSPFFCQNSKGRGRGEWINFAYYSEVFTHYWRPIGGGRHGTVAPSLNTTVAQPLTTTVAKLLTTAVTKPFSAHDGSTYPVHFAGERQFKMLLVSHCLVFAFRRGRKLAQMFTLLQWFLTFLQPRATWAPQIVNPYHFF